MIDDRLLEIGLEELLGNAPPPDIRATLRDRVREHSPAPTLRRFVLAAAGAAALIVAAIFVAQAWSGDGRTPSDSELAQLVRDSGDDLDAETLIRLAAKPVPGAAELLLGPLRRGRGEVLQATWKTWQGDRAHLAFLESSIRREALLAESPEVYFAAVVTLYRQKRYQAWNVCWAIADRFIRETVRTDVRRALELTKTMYWFYDFLNIAEPLPLVDLHSRVRRELRDIPAPSDPRAEIDKLLTRMK